MSTVAHETVRIRHVLDGDLEEFFEYQREPSATRMAAVPPRDRGAFMAHWATIRADPAVLLRTVLVDDAVAGNVVSWEQDGMRLVGYWLGVDFWGRGVATRALALFVDELPGGPLYAHVSVDNIGSIRVLEKCGFRPVEGSGDPVVAADGVEEYLFVRFD